MHCTSLLTARHAALKHWQHGLGALCALEGADCKIGNSRPFIAVELHNGDESRTVGSLMRRHTYRIAAFLDSIWGKRQICRAN